MIGEIPGHRLAREELDEIQSLATGDPPALRVESVGAVESDWLPIKVSLDCANVAVEPGHVRLAAREQAILFIPAQFPFSRPAVEVRHERFKDLPYVLRGREICLYHSDSDWNPADGMYGVIARLAAWYRRAAQGRLVEEGQPLHPPLAYRRSFDADCVVIRSDLPYDFEPAAAVLVRRNRWRVDLVKWLRPAALDQASRAAANRLSDQLSDAARTHGGPAFLAAVKILRAPLSFEFPRNVPALASALSAQQVSPADLLDHLAQVWVANVLTAARADRPMPLHVVLGAPMRGFHRAGAPQTHLAVWQLDAAEAAVIPSLLPFEHTGDAELAAWLREARQDAQKWMRAAPISWAEVQEARRQIVTRRDTGKPAQWLLGKTVLVLGCGALGARIAEHCVRAGVGRIVVADGDAVSPGVLVRQPFQEDDVGLPKARQLAERLARIRPPSGIEVVAAPGDVRRTLLASDAARPEADLIVDATANRGVSARIEWLRRTQQRRWPPILTVGVGHECERAIGALALPHASGAGADILQSFADSAVTGDELRDAAEDFFASPGEQAIFQPEIGCSEPTFTGSDPEVAAAAGQVFAWGLHVLRDYAAHRPVAPKSLLLARLPGDRARPTHVYLDWPNDATADDPRSGYQVRIRPQAMADMRAEALATASLCPPSWETGGVLLGYFDDACRVAWVTAAEGPSPDSERGEHYFRHGTEDVADRIAEHRAASGGRVRFVGMWHTHPGLHTAASSTDRRAMGSLLVPVTDAQVPRRAMQLILGGDADRWTRWLEGVGGPEVGFQLFRRSQGLAPRDSASAAVAQEQ